MSRAYYLWILSRTRNASARAAFYRAETVKTPAGNTYVAPHRGLKPYATPPVSCHRTEAPSQSQHTKLRSAKAVVLRRTSEVHANRIVPGELIEVGPSVRALPRYDVTAKPRLAWRGPPGHTRVRAHPASGDITYGLRTRIGVGLSPAEMRRTSRDTPCLGVRSR